MKSFSSLRKEYLDETYLEEKNKPTDPEKWARAKSAAKSKFAVYPSAYANAWASKKYKSMGGGWRSTSEEVELDENHIAIAMGKMLDDEGSMVLNQLDDIERCSKMIRDYVGNDYEKQLPAWVQSKVTLAADYINTVGTYLASKNEDVKEEIEIVYEANIQPTSAKSRSHISNLSNPTVNSVTHKSKQIGLITKQSDGSFHAHHSAAKLSHAQSGTFDTKDKAHQFIRNAHANAIKKGTLSDKFLKKEEVELDETAAWQRKEGKRESGGLNQKGVDSYRREHPGSKLKTAVTTKPSKLKPGSKAANRRKSFCARMSGMKKRLTSAKTAHDPDSRINKSLRKWNC